MNSPRKVAVTALIVLVGVVVCQVGDSVGIGAGATCKVFAEEVKPDSIPDGLKGFRGMVLATLTSKGEREFVAKVEKILKVWNHNEAKDPGSAIGKSLQFAIAQSRLAEQHIKTLTGLKVGDRIEVEGFHIEGDKLDVLEWLKKAE